jgi:putative oxidoreductase
MLQKIVKTENRFDLTILRIALGGVMFAHGAQKMLGWFGGNGFSATVNAFGQYMHIAAPIAVLVILIEFFGSLMLIAGSFTRVAALGMFGLFIGIIMTTHPDSFFMNWSGQAKGEGIEYDLLILGMSLVLLISGGGKFSLDSKLSNSNNN